MRKNKHQRAKSLPMPMYQRLQMMAAPRGAIENLARNSAIDEYQLGSIYAIAMICRKAANASGIEYSANPVFALGQRIRRGEAIYEEQIDACRRNMDECEAVLKAVSGHVFDAALRDVMVADEVSVAMRGYGVAEAMAAH